MREYKTHKISKNAFKVSSCSSNDNLNINVCQVLTIILIFFE